MLEKKPKKQALSMTENTTFCFYYSILPIRREFLWATTLFFLLYGISQPKILEKCSLPVFGNFILVTK